MKRTVTLRTGRRAGYAELVFAKGEQPDARTRSRLAAERFRWSARFRCYYGPGISAARLAAEFNRS